jgi:hypothetical protein
MLLYIYTSLDLMVEVVSVSVKQSRIKKAKIYFFSKEEGDFFLDFLNTVYKQC